MKRLLTNSNFNIFAETVASPSDPNDYCEASMDRLMGYLSPYITEIKGVRWKYRARNCIELIKFTTDEERACYERAYDNYLKACALIENRSGGGSGRFMMLVQFLKFRQAAELIRAPYLARRAYQTAMNENKSMLIACNFKETISKITSILVLDYNVPRERISLVWGGAANAATKKRKEAHKNMSAADRAKLLEAFASPEDRQLMKDLGLDLEETYEDESSEEETATKVDYDPILQLGTQNRRKRQEEIDRFQRDESQFCLFSFKAGGVGLSLHQHSTWMRQREGLICPTYSPVELVQGLGRGPRKTSKSDTKQTMIFYAGTIEVAVADRCSRGLKCIKKLYKKNVSWEDAIYEHARADIDARALVGEVDADIQNISALEKEEDEDE